MKTVVSNSTVDRGSLSPAYIKPSTCSRIEAKLEIGSSGWTRTNNPPVNSNHGSSAPSLTTETCRRGVSDAIVATTSCGKLRPNLRTGAFLPV